MSVLAKDALERILWSALYAAIAAAVIVLGDVEAAWAPIIVAGLTAIKVLVASKVGDPNTGGFTDTRDGGEL